ncbi:MULTISPECIES: thiol reductant ABC exporter subunit CydD [unclassified Streptococcus]|uniref:thiol reductant ABC exporter subunit CydD n=1 Tax=unclassified Streptococcus TaxID=2608887 RepID=UPI0010723996|nr:MULTISPECIES: thiol reductant ABC exporter subunit CydD [unclassified Streptococcus]MBF0786347.1 thiol reductant ABC exporter subunit CydD [Streptococcus sp. 19428wC2_LYSM12]MCQ9212456.1 thiol reductant ABC exporter subunit CydD [Streptococcus sp. B01]MCQ9213794.1 thiol reductant ABC exporter subunit CydD [Streptococcus sp. O1]TFV06757.1 thiol reductant ABC exporter subunit CydD [Streptococcus sp. LYSM12]
MLDKAVMRLSGVHKLLGLLAGLDILQAIFIIGQAAGLSQAITGVWGGKPLEEQLLPAMCFFICYLGRHIIHYLKNEHLDRFSSQQASQLRGQLLRKIFELGPHIVQKEGSGNVITMALDGISLVENYLHLILNKMMNMSIIPWLILIYIFYLDWESGLVLLIVFPIIIIFMIILGYAAQARADRQYAQYQLLSNHFLDTLRGLDTLKFFGRSKSYSKTIYQTSENFRKATMNALRIGILSTFALDFFTTLSIAVVAVLLGLRLINGQMLLFPALTILILAPEYFLPVRDFSSDYHATLDGKNALQSIQKILKTPSIRQEQVSITTWNNDSCLELEDISIAYGEKKLFAGTSLTLSGYQKIGIIGMSGSGKSSFINLLSGFLGPEKGDIRIDDVQLTNLDQEDWRKQLLYIPQHPYVFEMSLRDNITFYTPSASDTQVREAISVVGLDDLVASLPEGLDTRIGNGARPLSGGQAQRIVLARAFLDRERRILLLDEPTAHLDIETELELKEKMLPLMDNRLVLLATHRLHWLHQMDYILVLDQGKIVEMGTYDDLLAQKGKLYHLKTAMGGSHD